MVSGLLLLRLLLPFLGSLRLSWVCLGFFFLWTGIQGWRGVQYGKLGIPSRLFAYDVLVPPSKPDL